MRVVWTARARRDRDQIHAFIAQRDGAERANTVVVALTRAILRLAQYPGLGRPSSKPGVRELVVARLPYVVPYRVRDDQIQVLRILHQRRDRP
jgi:addiction module RelE/StbE family toxin